MDLVVLYNGEVVNINDKIMVMMGVVYNEYYNKIVILTLLVTVFVELLINVT